MDVHMELQVKVAVWSMVVLSLFVTDSICLGGEDNDHVCFRSIDSDQDGKVTFDEFKIVLGDDEEKFGAIDGNEDGTLSHDEYHQHLGPGSP